MGPGDGVRDGRFPEAVRDLDPSLERVHLQAEMDPEGWRPVGTCQLSTVPEDLFFRRNIQPSVGDCPPRRLGDVHRPFGCSLSHPHSPPQTEVAPLCVEEQGSPVSSPPFWPSPGFLDFYQGSQGATHFQRQRGV